MKHCTPTSFFCAVLLLALPSLASAQGAAPEEAAPVEAVPVETGPVEDLLVEDTVEAVPVQTVPVEAVPVQAVPVEDTYGGPALELPPEKDVVITPVAPTVTVGGYGEMHYSATMPEQGPMTNEVDFHRFVLYLGRNFNEDLRFVSEIEVEHAIVGDGKVGEVSVEQAYIDYRLSKHVPIAGNVTLRTGIVLVPMGIVNQWHEPPIFHGVERPNVDKVIIPSTWREAGIGLVGKPHPQVSYELYVMSGLDPLSYSRKSGIRGGRQKGGEARTDGLAFSGRFQFEPSNQSVIGVSGYFSQSGKNTDLLDKKVPVLGVSADARAKFEGVEARAEFAMFNIGDTDELNALQDAAGDPLVSVADRLVGAYGEVAYDLFHSLDTEAQLLPFGRFEYYDTDPDDDTRTIVDIVLGLTFRPIPQVVFKQDLTIRRPGGDVDGDNVTILNLGLGFLY